MITTEEFVARFHSLSGVTIGERQKNLFLLLHQIKESGSTSLDFASVQPRTPLEEKFKLETLIYFKKVPDLLEVLKSENRKLIHIILKHSSWFLQEAFRNISGEQLVTLIFPYISFNTKVKILNKLSLHMESTQQADEFYEAIEKKYGLYLACKLLPSCSSGLITNCVKSTKIKLTPRQLQYIISKYPEVTEQILKSLSDRCTMKDDYKEIFVFLANYDVALFLKLYKEYNLTVTVGWRITDKVIRKYRQQVISSPNSYYTFLHKKQICKSLNQDFGDFYMNLFPKTLEQFADKHDFLFSLLKDLPKKTKDVNLLLSAFEKLYGSQLWDHPKFVTPELLKILTPSERHKRLKIEYKPATLSEDQWNSYYKTEDSIPFLKKRISLSSSIQTRADLIELLVKTCKINEDKDALVNVCKYMLKQHRNDHITVRLAFIKTLKRNFKLENLNEAHWTPINELIQIFVVNDEPFYHSEEFLKGYMYFCLENGLPIKEQVIKWIKLNHSELNFFKEKPQYEKLCLLTFGETIPSVCKENTMGFWNMKFLNALVDWNKRHPDDEISIFAYENAIKSLKELLSQKECYYIAPFDIVKYCLQKKTYAEEKSDLLKVCFLFPDRFAHIHLLNWLIKYEPLLVLSNMSGIVQAVLRFYYKISNEFFWKYAQNYSHLEIPLKMIDICSSIALEDRTKVEDKRIPKAAIEALSHLMLADDFMKFISPYYPLNMQIDNKTDEGQRLYALQKDIGAYLKNIKPPSRALEAILMFCKEDFLRSSQRSLYSVCGNINEDKLIPFIKDMAGRSVSVRKHALRLTFRVLDKQQVWNILNQFMESEKKASTGKFTFKCAFKFFVKNPNDYSWELVKLSISTVDVNDREAVDTLMQFDKVPRPYVEKYVLFCWEYLNKLPDLSKLKQFDKTKLLNYVNSEVIQFLPKEFCEAIINEDFFKCKQFTSYQAAVESFACKYIIYCNSQAEQDQRLRTILMLVKDSITQTLHNPELQQTRRCCMTYFVKQFCSEFLNKKCSNKEVLIKFIEKWNELFQPHEYFGEYLHLQFTLVSIEKLSLPQIGQKISILCNNLAQSYGTVIIGMFREKIDNFKDHFVQEQSESNKSLIVFVENLIKPQSSMACLLLGILLLNNVSLNKETEGLFNNILHILQEKHDPVIQMYLHQHFKSATN